MKKVPPVSRFHKFIASLKRPPKVSIHVGGLTEIEALDLEAKLIKKLGRLEYDPGGILLNMTIGGKAPPNHSGRKFPNRKSPSTKGKPGPKWSEAAKRRHRKLMKSIMRDPEMRKKVSLAKMGRPGPKMSAEAKAKISKVHKGIKSPAKSRSKMGAKNPLFGKKWFHRGKEFKAFDPDLVPRGWGLGFGNNRKRNQ